MNNWKEFESNTITIIFEQFKNSGIDVVINNEIDKDIQIIISGLPLIGEEKRHLNLEMFFLPIEENNRETMDYNFMQFFVAIKNDITDKTQTELIPLMNTINATLPIGAFGVITKDRLLYFKYCCAFTQNMTGKNINSIVAANLTMIITALTTYTDRLCDINR